MNKRIVYIAIFVVSITGMAVVQYQYLRIGLNLARVQFGQHISAAGEAIKEGLYGRTQLTYLLEGTLEQDSTRFNSGLSHMTDASRFYMEDFLREKLIDNEIDADFTFSLMTRDSSFYISSAPLDRSSVSDLTYPLEIDGYLPAKLGQRVILQLQFTHLTGYFLSQLNGLTMPSIIFLIGILIAVLWVLRTFYWQQRVLTITHDFINNLTHELRTPVFSISLAAKILKERVGEQEKPLTANILEQTGRISNHIDKVLELGALERAKAAIVLEFVDFGPPLRLLCEQFKSQCKLEDITFKYTLPIGAIPLQASAFHLENVMNNLLDNARKYGKGTPIEVFAKLDGKYLELQITDKGPGIAPEEHEKIFQKYYRIVEGNKQGVRGYGLGLSYVKTVIERHNGKIFVAQGGSKGTTFVLKLPLSNYGSKRI